jgi:hypothetical protein
MYDKKASTENMRNHGERERDGIRQMRIEEKTTFG